METKTHENGGELVVGRVVQLSGPTGPGEQINGQGLDQVATKAEPILYDANAQQRIPFMIEHQGENFEVLLVLDAQTDAALREYDRLCDRRLIAANQKETGQRNALESFDNTYEAGIWLFNDRAVTAEGFNEPGDAMPEDWKDFIANEHKAAVIDDAYLAAMIVPLPIATPGKRLPLTYSKDAPVSTIQLQALFEGNEIILRHELAEPSAEQVAQYKSILKERLIVQGTRLGKGETRIPPKSLKLATLYDQLRERVTGYAGDRVPLHHKALVVIEHVSKAVEAVRKN